MNAAEEKRRQRQAGISARAALDDAARRAFDGAIAKRVLSLAAFERAALILSYCAAGGEADPAAIDAEARRRGIRVAYPLCRGKGRMDAAVPDGPDAMQRGMYGIPAPAEGRCTVAAPEEVDFVLVPCAAFDGACRRIGMGGGYYDRYLPLCKNAFTVGLAYEVQRVPSAAAEAHDRTLHAAASEARLYCRRGQGV